VGGEADCQGAKNIALPDVPSEALSFAHSSGQGIPSSQEDVAELAGAVFLDEQARYRLLKLRVSTTHNPTGK
jgi:hypothetical protein